MAISLLKFLFGSFFFSVALWIAFLFVAWLLALVLGCLIGISLRFRVGGLKCLKDVVLKFKKGAIESISVREIKLSLRQCLAILGLGLLSKDPKLEVLICGLELVMRPPSEIKHKVKSRKPRSSGSSSSGKGKKLMALVNVARFFSLSVSDIALKTPKATLEIKEFRVGLHKDGRSNPNLFFKLFVSSISACMREEQGGIINQASNNSNSQQPVTMTRASSQFRWEELCLFCEFGHDRKLGVALKDLDIACGEIMMNLSEKLLLKSKSPSKKAPETVTESDDKTMPADPQNKQEQMTKYSTLLPEKASFRLPKLAVMFIHQERGLFFENQIIGLKLKSCKLPSIEGGEESTKHDVQLYLSEIHLFREAGTSVLEVSKLNVSSSVYVPMQPTSVIRAEVDVQIGVRCNIVLSRLKPWMRVYTMKKKSMVLKEEVPKVEKPKSTGSKAIIKWKCSVLAPEITIELYSISGLPLFHGCSQSSRVVANNVSSAGITVHTEIGGLNLHLSDEFRRNQANSGSILHVPKVSLEWGRKVGDTVIEKDPKSGCALSVDVSEVGLYLTMKRLESLISTAMLLQALLKTTKSSSKKKVHIGGSSGKGTQLLKFNLGRCSINFRGDVGLENTIVEDPKRVNYGSQGGRVIINVCADGTKRTASIISVVTEECKKLKYSVSLEILQFTFCVNKEKNSVQFELERAKAIYQEHPEEEPSFVGTQVLLLDLQNAKFVKRSGGQKAEIAVCSLFSATEIAIRWEPDSHISLFELATYLKLLVQHHKLQAQQENEDGVCDHTEIANESVKEQGQAETLQKKESVFAVDVEMLRVSAEAGDGVEATVQIESIFSENARIGVLLEGLILCFDGCQLVKSSRMQISRIPNASSPGITVWDFVVQGLDIHICLPYRLQLRAIDDAVEDQLRALKLITSAKSKLIFPVKKNSSKPKKPSSSNFGCLKFYVRKLTAEIEEEPLQGWLDEHFHLMKNEASELAVRLKYLEDLVSGNTDNTEAAAHEKKLQYKGVDIDLQDPSAVDKIREDIYKDSFQSYYQACQNLKACEGSGAWREGFQAGFRPSTQRASLLSIIATDLDLTLMMIEGGEAGMVNFVKELDPVARKNNIPFSKLYGTKLNLRTNTLVAQIRNYTYPLFSGTSGRCEGRLVLAQQATSFQPQVQSEVYIGRWRKVSLLRSATGTTPPMKTYTDLPLHFQKGIVSFGVGYEPVFTDISWAFTVALRRANLSVKNPNAPPTPPKKEKSLPWWDEMRNYIHGHISLVLSETQWYIFATADPYEKLDKLDIVSDRMEIKQSDGQIHASAKDFKVFTSSLEYLAKNRNLKFPPGIAYPFLEVPWLTLELNMDWGCDSGTPLNHYLFSLPNEGRPREYIFDPFRSTSLSIRCSVSFRPLSESSSTDTSIADRPPTVKLGAHDLEWIVKFWNLNYLPPCKLRMFSRYPRFGVPRIPRSGNLSLDRVMTEFMIRIDSTPICIKNIPLDDDDPSKGLTFKMTKLKFELVNSRGRQQKYFFDSVRDPLDLVYQGVDLHIPKVLLDRDECTSVAKLIQMTRKNSQLSSTDKGLVPKSNSSGVCTDRQRDDGFFLSSDYFTIRKQTPKADPARLSSWQEAGRRNLEITCVKSDIENGSESDENGRSDLSDDDGYNVVVADSCQRIFVYGLKLLWNIENRDAVWSWGSQLAKAVAPPKASPSRQYAQRIFFEENQKIEESEIQKNEGLVDDQKIERSDDQNIEGMDDQKMDGAENKKNDGLENSQDETLKPSNSTDGNSLPEDGDALSSEQVSSASPAKMKSLSVNDGSTNESEEGTRHFMVNVVEPQFNLHSEEANGRFLLAAVSGRVLARSFHSVLKVGQELMEKTLGSENAQSPESQPEMAWTCMEISAMLEHVQAHVAPTDVDPGAGLQWLPKIRRSSPKVKRTGALLERVFMPCDMYFRYTRHKGGTPELKMKPLKELIFNSQNITVTMTSRQFQETDAFVPDGVKEVELARINLEQKEWEQKVLLDDIRKLSFCPASSGEHGSEQEGGLWMVTGGRSTLVKKMRNDLGNVQKSRKAAIASLRTTMQKAAELRLMEKEKNKSPSYAMRVSLQINKVAWSMLVDGKSFAESEINDMIYDFDRDFKDIGVARFTIKSFVIRDCFPSTKSDTVLCAWNPPPEWGRKVMLRIDAKQGAPKEGRSPIELFQVDIYPLKIHLTDLMYSTLWGYLFPEEDQDSHRRQEVWKVSTTAGLKRVKKGSANETSGSNTKDSEGSSKSSTSSSSGVTGDSQGSKHHLRRSSSFDRTWEEDIAESVANELMSQVANEDDSTKGKTKDSKSVKQGKVAQEEKKLVKPNADNKTKPTKLIEFRNVKISQVELQITLENMKLPVSDLRLLMDEFNRAEFVGTWKRLFARIRKHVIWGVLKSVTGMQKMKFKDKGHSQKEIKGTTIPEELNLSDSDGGAGESSEQYAVSFLKRPAEGAGDGFVTSVRGLFSTQRRKARQMILRTMRGEDDEPHMELSENEAEFSPFARQLTISRAKRLINPRTKKLRSRKGNTPKKISRPPSPKETINEGDSSGSSSYEDLHD
ncbi:hypothetical protein V2J09_023815 [Rumex salicifolius]